MTAPRAYYQLRVAEVITEAGDACSLVLTVPPELAAEFGYRPGQFLTLRIPHDQDGSVARCYSLSSSPHTGDMPTITVKRMPGGYASNWIADHLAAGSVLDALPPAGTFSPRSLEDDFLLFAGGSGITPVMSILKSALALGNGKIVLIYANRDERSVIFDAELRGLAAADGPRLELPAGHRSEPSAGHRSEPSAGHRPEPSAGSRLLMVHWLDSVQGSPTAAGLAELARPYAGFETFICGPDPFLAVVRQALGLLGVPAQRLHVERFLSLADNPFEVAEAADGMAATLQVTLDGQTRLLPWPPGTRMLDILIEAGLDPPFSCREGICGACACRITGGEVDMVHNEVLEPEDVADSYVLACQAVPLTAEVSITYS